MTPRVSVLMSVYNGERYLEEAIDCILQQTFREFEFIIVDDGSSDATPRLLSDYGQRDPRIILHHSDENRGLSVALNLGIQHARGEYIARMDADDISLAHRLAEQVTFMDAHPEVGVCGTWVQLIGDRQGNVWKYPLKHEAICARMLFANALAHPSVMIRRSAFQQNGLQYDPQVRYAQDYELWSRAIWVMQFANLDQILLKYRIHLAATGASHRSEQYQIHDLIYRRFFELLDLQYTREELFLHQQIGTDQPEKGIEFLRRCRDWLERLLFANRKIKLISPGVFEEELGWRWTHACYNSFANPAALFLHILSSPLEFRSCKGMRKAYKASRFLVKRILRKR